MNEHLRERIMRKLDTLSDERGYQILDYVEFLESRYAERQQSGATAFTRFAEAMGLMNRAANVLNGALAAGRSVANDIVTATTTRTGSSPQAPGTSASSGTPATGTPTAPSAPSNGASTSTTTASAEASSAAHDTKNPGSGEEKL
jgi:hypothetical protein